MNPDTLGAVTAALSDTLGAFASALPDSAALAGWLLPQIARLGIPPWIAALVVGAFVALAVDALEGLSLKVADLTKRIPVLGPVLGLFAAAWRAEWKTAGGSTVTAKAFVNPLLALVVGAVGAGNPLVGVIAAGVRSMGTKPVNAWALRRLRLGAFALGLGLAAALLAGDAHAAAAADSSGARRGIPLPEWIAVGVGAGYRAEDLTRAPGEYRPWLGGRVSLILGSHLSLVVIGRRDADGTERHTSGEAGIWAMW